MTFDEQLTTALSEGVESPEAGHVDAVITRHRQRIRRRRSALGAGAVLAIGLAWGFTFDSTNDVIVADADSGLDDPVDRDAADADPPAGDETEAEVVPAGSYDSEALLLSCMRALGADPGPDAVVEVDSDPRFGLCRDVVDRNHPDITLWTNEFQAGSDAQQAAMADGQVTMEEYQAAFDRFYDCATDAGVDFGGRPEFSEAERQFVYTFRGSGPPGHTIVVHDACHEWHVEDLVFAFLEAPAEPRYLLPGDGWQLERFHSIGVDLFDEPLLVAATHEGIFGPAVMVHFVAGVGMNDFQDAPSGIAEATTPAGTPVQLRYNDRFGWSVVIFDAPGGSLVVNSFGVPEADVLTAIDRIAFVDAMITITEALPLDLAAVELSSSRGHRTEVVASDGDTPGLSILMRPADSPSAWYDALFRIWLSPDPEPLATAVGTGVLVRGDDEGAWPPGVVLLVDGWLYSIENTRRDSTSASMTMAELEAVVRGMEWWTDDEIVAELGNADRATFIGGLLDETPLPPENGLGWLAEGPPVNPALEIGEIHQILQCTWVGYWETTGDTAALDELERSNEWPSGELFADQLDQAELDPREVALIFFLDGVDEARAPFTMEEREASSLRRNCGWYLGGEIVSEPF